MEIPTFWAVIAVILLLLELWTISRVLKSHAPVNSRCMWVAVVIFLPLFGMLAWFMFGAKQHAHPKSTS
ncbi:PLD nuclease N-terminal domain-containing protein [Pseudomonas sp. SIMBA_077]